MTWTNIANCGVIGCSVLASVVWLGALWTESYRPDNDRYSARMDYLRARRAERARVLCPCGVLSYSESADGVTVCVPCRHD